MKPVKVVRRNNQYYIRRRVPTRFEHIEPRRVLTICLFTDSLDAATRKAPQVWGELIESWEARLRGQDARADLRLAAARDLAARRGWSYMDVRDVSELPIEQIMARVKGSLRTDGKVDYQLADALLGLPPERSLTPEEALKEYYTVRAEHFIGMSEDQMRRHRNPRKKITAEFVKLVPKKTLSEITTKEMYVYRDWLVKQVRTGVRTAATANKELSTLIAMWRAVGNKHSIKLQFETAGLALKETVAEQDRTRPPMSDKWITSKLLATGALDKLNTDARMIVLGMINTGYRPSEGAGLLPHEIRLDTDVPHIVIQANANRTLKTGSSKRLLPLTGVSLEAFREASMGFPRYAKNSAGLSGTVNQYLARNGLLESPDHSLYSLRHSMEDRMLRAGIDERIRMDVLGHKINRERYGAGGGLEHVHGLLKAIAL